MLTPTVWSVPGERDSGHCGCFHCQRRQIFRLQRVDVGLATGTSEELCLDGQRVQEVIDPLGCFIRIEALTQFRVLRRNADRAAARVAVIAIACFNTHLGFKVCLGDVLVTVHRHEGRVTDRNRIRAQRDGFRNVGTVSNTASVHERNLAALAEVINRFTRLTDCRNAGNAGVFGRKVWSSARAALHAVDIDGIRGHISRPSAHRHKRALHRALSWIGICQSVASRIS